MQCICGRLSIASKGRQTTREWNRSWKHTHTHTHARARTHTLISSTIYDGVKNDKHALKTANVNAPLSIYTHLNFFVLSRIRGNAKYLHMKAPLIQCQFHETAKQFRCTCSKALPLNLPFCCHISLSVGIMYTMHILQTTMEPIYWWCSMHSEEEIACVSLFHCTCFCCDTRTRRLYGQYTSNAWKCIPRTPSFSNFNVFT